MQIKIRKLATGDTAAIARGFAIIGWTSKSESLFARYVREQQEGRRDVLVAFVDDDFAGYVTINWQPTYPPLASRATAEIQDINLLPTFRRRGVATRLVDQAEALVAIRCEAVGIVEGLRPGYNAAQRMYVLRGSVPDGNGVTVGDRFISEGQTVMMNDEVVLHLEKPLTTRV